MSVRILFTSAGRRVMFMRQVRVAAERLGTDVWIAATDVDPLAPAMTVADHSVRAPLYRSVGYVDFLLELAERHGISVVVPLTDPDARLLALHRADFEARGVIACAVEPTQERPSTTSG